MLTQNKVFGKYSQMENLDEKVKQTFTIDDNGASLNERLVGYKSQSHYLQ